MKEVKMESSYSSGTYFYQIEVGDYTETRKLVILNCNKMKLFRPMGII
tara:strand:- start:617 stop:760 length:144 start_codon:yes stop_codon:yes gene_type:complete